MSSVSVPFPWPALVKPTLETPFHLDYSWWERNNLRFGVELRAHLCPAHQSVYGEHENVESIDWVDERTGEVTRVDGVQHVLRVHCSKQPDYINADLPLVDAVVRVFLSNGNKPLTCRELGDIIGRSPETILRTLAGQRVYKGIRPAR